MKPHKTVDGVSGVVTAVTDEFSSAPQSSVCHYGNLLLTDRASGPGVPKKMSSQAQATRRMIMGSFAAGVSAMVLLGLIAPVAMQSSLTVRDAFAATLEERGPAIEPLNVAAIEAQLAEADRLMADARSTTADEMAMLERLAR
jgi:hypothetical protein